MNGYYYTRAQADLADNACPEGWHIPDQNEVNDLIGIVNATANRDAAESVNISKWWTTSHGVYYGAFAGSCDGSGWGAWGVNGGWWYGSDGQYFIGATGGMNSGTSTSYWFSVRCVQNTQ